MEQSLSRIGTAIKPRIDLLVGLASVSGFFWLLAHDLIHPIVVYLLQLYLSF